MLRPRQQGKLARGVKDEEHAMSHKLNAGIAVIGIDTGATVGIFGSACERVVVATASARSLPALMCWMDAGRLSNAI